MFQKGNKFRFKKGHKFGIKTRFKSGDTRPKEENSTAWKKDDPCYSTIHKWLVRKKGNPKICVDCGITCKERKLDWSSMTHKYERNLNEFVRRCRSCHMKYDIKNGFIKIHLDKLKRKKRNLKGQFIN